MNNNEAKGRFCHLLFQACWIGSSSLVLSHHYSVERNWIGHHLEALRLNDKSWKAAGPRLVEPITSLTVIAPPVMEDRTELEIS
jgi:hypothetical protein